MLATVLAAGQAGADPQARALTRVDPADLAIINVTVVDVENRRFVDAQTIAVKRDKIVYIGARAPEWERAKRKIDGSEFIALPGFVDTHTHLWQHAVRSVEPGGDLQFWVRAVYRRSHHFQPGEVRDVTRAAAAQALLNGITTVSDFASVNFTESASRETIEALKASHIGGAVIWWRPAVFLPWTLQDRQLAELDSVGGDRIATWVGFGPLSFMPIPMVYDGIRTARRNGLRMSEHSMENLQEARDFQRRAAEYLERLDSTGGRLAIGDRAMLDSVAAPKISKVNLVESLARIGADLQSQPDGSAGLTDLERQALRALGDHDPPSPIPLLEYWGALDDFLAIHGVWPALADIERFRVHSAAISYNPESNMYLSSGVSPIRAYARAGILVTLGTDGAASNDRISMFDAMRTASLLQKVAFLQPEVTRELDSWFYLQAATINGAKALGIGGRTGSLSVGKEADILLLDRRKLSMTPFNEVIGATLLTNSAEARDLAFVIADGQIVASEGRLILVDEAALAARLNSISEALALREREGKIWAETVWLGDRTGAPTWRYRSIHLRDEVDVRVKNTQRKRITVAVAISGTTFGGATPMTLHPASLRRYPMTAPRRFEIFTWDLAPGQVLEILKRRGEPQYAVKGPSDSVVHQGSGDAEQIAVYEVGRASASRVSR